MWGGDTYQMGQMWLNVQHWVIPNVSSRRLQTWKQEFESDTTRPNWEDRLIVKYECASAILRLI
jgi:hypothetical protein